MIETSLILAGRFAIAALFLQAALMKLVNLDSAENAVARYGVVPELFVPTTARAVGLLEIAVAALALVGITTPGAGMLCAYAVLMVWVIYRDGRGVKCGCGGSDLFIDWWLVLRNLTLAAVAIASGSALSGSAPLAAVSTALLMAACVGTLYGALNQLHYAAQLTQGWRVP